VGDLSRESEVREAYAAHSTELYGLAIRALEDPGLAEEAVEQTFLLVLRATGPVDPEAGGLRSRLFATLRGVLVDLESARATRSPDPVGEIEPTSEHLDQSFRAWQVEEAMRRLSNQHRQILVETVYRGRPYAKVAAELGLPQDTVKSRVNDGLQALKAALTEVAIEGCDLRDSR
jgi:RNA polymerase sigma-70 factor, ECF subfamily